jgi:glyoxylase-like metal-dependent hydrolase (beta-lactamase superfamily II)
VTAGKSSFASAGKEAISDAIINDTPVRTTNFLIEISYPSYRLIDEKSLVAVSTQGITIAQVLDNMRIHHLNCISTCPLGGRLMDGSTESILRRGLLSCHCLLIETASGLVLVDTGLGLQDVHHPHSRLSRFFLTLVSPDFREEMTAVRQIERLGYRPEDVRHILLSHLDFDHAGGLDDFPQAKIHMIQIERDYALSQKTWMDRQRFRPQQWSSRNRWRVYSANEGDNWFGFKSVRPLEETSPDIVMVPLRGHTLGHAGIAVKDEDRWKFLAGDAYFFHEEMNLENPWCTPGLRFYQWMLEKDRSARLGNQARLRELIRTQSDKVEVFCAHDVVEFERLSGRSTQIPAEALVGGRRVA